jgi:hypothetical protein
MNRINHFLQIVITYDGAQCWSLLGIPRDMFFCHGHRHGHFKKLKTVVGKNPLEQLTIMRGLEHGAAI